MKLKSLIVAVSLLTNAALSITLLADDQIIPVQGSTVSGTIEEVTKDKVTIKAKNGSQEFTVVEIARLVYDGEPSSMKRTKELVANGQYDQALLEIKKVDPNTLKSDESKKDHGYYRALIEGRLALLGKGNATAASTALRKFVGANPNSHHFYEAAEMLGELATLQGEKANQYFAALTKAPYPELVARGRFLEARALIEQGNIAEARKACSEVAGVQANKPSTAKIQRLALVLQARCDIAENNADKALETIKKLIQENDSQDAELFARLKNAEGECYMKLNNLTFARLAYLTTDGLYASQPDAHAEALFHLSQIWAKLGNAQQAAEAKEKLNANYVGSIWAKGGPGKK